MKTCLGLNLVSDDEDEDEDEEDDDSKPVWDSPSDRQRTEHGL